ncbi:MAG: hypothetical protein IJ115_08515 [Erysipelotrichaceae bacterium]|nr:hypothetical protein [Erysipelotrichaceae bacterium]
MRIRFFNMYLTLDKIILLFLSLVLIFMLFGFVANLLRKGIKNKKVENTAITILQLAFMVIVLVLMLKYIFK